MIAFKGKPPPLTEELVRVLRAIEKGYHKCLLEFIEMEKLIKTIPDKEAKEELRNLLDAGYRALAICIKKLEMLGIEIT